MKIVKCVFAQSLLVFSLVFEVSLAREKGITDYSNLFTNPIVADSSESGGTHERLSEALQTYESSSGQDFKGIEDFLQKNPESKWAVSLHLNMGYAHYATGYFSKALKSWRAAWDLSRKSKNPVIQRLGNLAVAEYAKMNTRIGRKDEIDRIIEQTKDVKFSDNANVVIQSAIEGRWVMEKNPGVAFRCGPYALFNVIECARGRKPPHERLDKIKSPETGFSLDEVGVMAEELDFPMVSAHRSRGAEVMIPSVVHWKVGHFGALVRKEGEHYLLRDPTFGNETWMTRDAIDEEASGCFLVLPGSLPEGWRLLSKDEASRVYGKGHSGNGGEPETGPEDPRVGGSPEGCPPGAGMATYSFHTLLASLSIVDTPVGYQTPVGEDVYVTVRYNQREYAQPAILNHTNFSPQWVSNWVSYITDNPLFSAGNVTLYQRGGGTEIFIGGIDAVDDPHDATVVYRRSVQNQTILRKLDPHSYRLDFPDGSHFLYAQEIGTVGTARKVFLSQVVDPFGNVTLLSYDRNLPSRLDKVIDVFGRETEFRYEVPNEDYLVSRVIDPFGREAVFNYTDFNSTARLTSIVDVVGIQSSFGYSENFEITSLTTPYGTTTFELSPFRIRAGSLIRFIEATDPDGELERVEMNLSGFETNMPFFNEPRPDPNLVGFTTHDYDDRNSFYWDKQAMRYAEGNYQAAHLYKWIQPGSWDSSTSILESEKPALEGRIWYNYPDQQAPFIQGSSDRPSVMARLVEGPDGIPVTQAIFREYNELGNLTRSVDPIGRETVIEYEGSVAGAVEGIDLTAIKVKVGESWDTIATYSDYLNHLPRTVTDASGGQTFYTYNGRGQILTITNALGEVISNTYDDHGNLTKVDGPLPGDDDSVEMTYDAFARVRTITNIDGSTLTYDYDDLDRVTRITYPDASFEEFTFANLSLVASRDRLGRITTYTYTPLLQLESMTDPAERTTRFEWCRCGDLRAIFDPMGRKTLWKRDVQGRVTAKQYADGSKIHYRYHASSGRMSQRIDEEGQITAYSYNLDGTLANRSYPNAKNPTPAVSFTYDPNYNRRLTMSDGLGETSFTYHPAGSAGGNRLASIDGPWANDLIQYSYDALNRQISRSINGVAQSLVFDDAGRLDSMTNALGVFDLAYVGATSRLQSMTHESGIGTVYDYHEVEADFRLKQILNHSTDGSTVISRFDYVQDALGRIHTWNQQQSGNALSDDWAIGYDTADQLSDLTVTDSGSNETTSGWTYDPAGNRLTETIGNTTEEFHYNGLNQLIETSVDYPEMEFEWDAENRLISITQGSRRSEFEYDGMGRRIRIRETEDNLTVSDHTYLWCGMEICEERDEAGSTVRKRFFSRGMVDASGTAAVTYLYGLDHLGSIRDLISFDGAIAESISYDAWGGANHSNATQVSTFTYTGHFAHLPSGLVLAPFRAYDPEIGRWISRDPIGEMGGRNLYGYVLSKPLTHTDPLGLVDIAVGFGANFSAGDGRVSFSYGVYFDTNSGDIGLYFSDGSGSFASHQDGQVGGAGVNVSLGIDGVIIDEISGNSSDISGDIPLFGATGFYDGCGNRTGTGLSLGAGIGLSSGRAKTKTIRLFNLF